MQDVSTEFWIVIVYTILFVVQLVVNFINFLRTGKMSAMIFKPPIESDSVVEENSTVSDSSVSTENLIQSDDVVSVPIEKDVSSGVSSLREFTDQEVLVALARLLKGGD